MVSVYIVGDMSNVNEDKCGTKCGMVYRLTLPAGGLVHVHWILIPSKDLVKFDLGTSMLRVRSDRIINMQQRATDILYKNVSIFSPKKKIKSSDNRIWMELINECKPI